MTIRSVFRAISVAVAMVLATGGASLAQAPKRTVPPVVVIIVDVPQIQRDSSAGKALMTQRDKYQQSFQADFNAARQALQVSDQELAKQKGTIPQEVYDQKAKALEQQVVAFQRRTQVAVRSLEKSSEIAASELMNAILSITGELAGELGANLVVPKQQVVLHEPSMDVTAQVIERLNRKLPSVNFPPPVVDEPALAPQVSPKTGKK